MVEIRRTSGDDIKLIKTLLGEADLPYQDLTAAHMDGFLSLYNEGRLTGCVGLEVFADTALLRSLVVRAEQRGGGLGSRLVAAAEDMAASRGVRSLYLLTTTAEVFFAARGYLSAERQSAPTAIQQTSEFLSLCPASAAFMRKVLPG